MKLDLKDLRAKAEAVNKFSWSYAPVQADIDFINAANPQVVLSLLDRIEKLTEALKFYAAGHHFDWHGDEDFAPETVSGEPSNIECGGDDSNSFTLENGGTARLAIAELDAEEMPSAGE